MTPLRELPDLELAALAVGLFELVILAGAYGFHHGYLGKVARAATREIVARGKPSHERMDRLFPENVAVGIEELSDIRHLVSTMATTLEERGFALAARTLRERQAAEMLVSVPAEKTPHMAGYESRKAH